MSSFLEAVHDLEPPPSSQPEPTWAPPSVVETRARIRQHALRAASRNATKRSVPTPHATTASPAAQQSSSGAEQGDQTRSVRRNNDAQSRHTSSTRTAAAPTSASILAPVPVPAVRSFFDSWNSSSTGHQRAENRLAGSTSWRASRNLKLGAQFGGGLRGGDGRVADTIGAGSQGFGTDGRKATGGWQNGAEGLRHCGQLSLAEVWSASKASKDTEQQPGTKFEEPKSRCRLPAVAHSRPETVKVDKPNLDDILEPFSKPVPGQIFEGLCFYVNGSTAPLVSDHHLKRLLAERGAKISIALGRRTVTHVILGNTNALGGAGGGLAAGKIQKEIARAGGKGVKFVRADWVLESIRAQRRLPEARFPSLKLAAKGQNSIYGMTRLMPPESSTSNETAVGEGESSAGG